MAESNFQSKVAGYLRRKGCYVLVTTPRPGIPDGCPDIIALVDGGGWLALELKASKNEKFQPLQEITVKKLDGMYYSRVVYPENWEDIKKELEKII